MIVSGIKKVSGKTQLEIIEQNVVPTVCNVNPLPSYGRRLKVDADTYYVHGFNNEQTSTTKWFYNGFIRHNLAGIYGDNGWHNDGTSQAFRDRYLDSDRHSDKKIGWAFDNNGGGPFVHRVHRVELQDFVNTNTRNRFGTDGETALALAPNRREAFLIKEGFWGEYKCLPGPKYDERGALRTDGSGNLILESGNVGGAYWLGAPTNNEHPSNGTVFQDFECGFMYMEGSTVKVHLDPDRSANCPVPQLDTYTLVAKSKEACPNMDVESNWPVGALCSVSQETCDGKDNNSDGFADENCGNAPTGMLRIRYSVLGCAERVDVVGSVNAPDGSVMRSSWNPPFCRLENSDAILCDVPVDQSRGGFMIGNVISRFSGRTHSVCERQSMDEPYHWFGELSAEWNGAEIEPQFLTDAAADSCEFLFSIPASESPTAAFCPNGACDQGETCASCQDDCCPPAPTITSPVSGSSWMQGNAVLVSWTESADAKRYMLAFCRDAQYADCPSLVDGIDIGLTQYQMSGLSTGTWYVSVRAIPWDESGWGHYSAPVQFSVIAGNSGGAPVEIALPDNPSDGGTNEINPAPSCDNQCTEGIDCYDDRTMGDCLGPTDDVPCTHWLNSRTCEEHWTCVRGQGCVPCGSSGQVCCVLEEPCRNGRMCLGSGLCTIVCDADADGHLIPDCGGDDCDDMSAVRYPGRTESCDGLDNDCDGQTDEGYDLLSDPDNCGACQNTCRRPYALCACVNGTCSFTGCESGRTNANGSWDDGCEAVSPTCTESLWYRDADADGYGTPASSVSECSAPNGYVSSSEDCNDADPDVHPSASESCNNRDDDCDGQVDEGIASLGACTSGTGACARTGQLVCRSGAVQCDAIAGSPSAEICANGIDEDCDGTADEGCSTVCDPSDITCSSCYEPVRTGEFMTCLDEQGRLFYLMSAFSYEESPIPNGDASRNPWHAYIWLEAATSAPWWIELDLMPVSGITGAAYAQLTSNLPSGLCPFTDGSYRHPIRVSNPYPGTYDENGRTFARDGSMHVCGDSQPGLTTWFEYLNDCAIAVERDAASGEWLPAAERAEDDMTGGRIHCVP